MSERESDHEFPGIDGAKPRSQVRTRISIEKEPDPPGSSSSSSRDSSSSTSTSSWHRLYRSLKPLLGYLPTGAYESETEYDGLLSYSVEIHTAIIGIAAGVFAATTGDLQAVMGLLAVALGIGRMQQPQKIREQIKREPWYFIATFGVTYFLLARDVPTV